MLEGKTPVAQRMAKHAPSLLLSCEGSQTTSVPLSIVHMPAASTGNSKSQPTVLHSETGQKMIQMIKVGNNIFQVTSAGTDIDESPSNMDSQKPRMSFADGSNKMIKIAYVKREREELSNSYSSHNEDDDEDNAHLADEESSEQPEGSLLNLALANGSENSTSTVTTVVQGPDGRFFIPVPVLSSNVTNLPHGLVVQTSDSGSVGSPPQGAEEVTMKRELRLLKNREAARECRRKKKEYVRCLENRVALLENQNKTLISELKSLKELYCQKEPHN